jgi:hypothetical protein
MTIQRRAEKIEGGRDPGEDWAVEQLNTAVFTRGVQICERAKLRADQLPPEIGMREIDAAIRGIGALHQKYPITMLLDLIRNLSERRLSLARFARTDQPYPAA